MRQKKEILYPVLLECCQYTDDPFWKNVFEELAYGVPPFGIYFSKDFLCSNYKGKEFFYKIERKEPKVLFDEIFALLYEKQGILSQKQKIQKKLNFLKENKEKDKSWNSIRKKNIRDSFYENFVIEMKKKYSLSLLQSRYLLSVILLGLMFKSISSKDITFEDDKIVSINGISFDTGKIYVEKSLFSEGTVESYLESMAENYQHEEDNRPIHESWPYFLKYYQTQYKYIL